MAASAGQRNEKLDEAQASARSCAGRPDFLPCDGLSMCATHSHGKCFKLHWCCHLGWCHCKYVYQPMTSVCQLPSTPVPASPSSHTHTTDLSVSLADRYLSTASAFQAPPCPPSPKFCLISDLFHDDYLVKRINGKMCYVQRILPPPHVPSSSPEPPPRPPQAKPRVSANTATAPKMDHCSSPSSSEDSGINALGGAYVGSCDEGSSEESEDEEEEEEEEEEELSSDGESSLGSVWGQGARAVVAPSLSVLEILEKIETTV
ncbi:LOW QUALITY PROTEIN: UPF0524 protein C3orf70 homolog [Osmerus mordax]|uniref:LOW QUALITY PROTEIN: UPF0524 protein C3orf70 homolog n=1 Tax=Osmerus mordax TaxID=8014 RepID=UPI00351070AF